MTVGSEGFGGILVEKGEGMWGISSTVRSGVQLSTAGACWDESRSIAAQGMAGLGQVGPGLRGGRNPSLSLVVSQGVDEGPDGLRLISDIIHEKLGIEMSVLMGANIANEVAEEKFCETTIGKEPTSLLISSLSF